MKLTRREREKLRKNQEIIEASIKVFSEKGFYGATMHDIAEVVEMGVGTLYQYFKSKDDLYYNAILYKLNEFHDFYGARLREGQNFIDSISDVIAAWIEYFSKNNDFFAIVFSEWLNVKKSFARKLKKRLTNEFTEKYNEIVRLIQKGKGSGEISGDVSTEVLSSMIFGTIQHMIHKGAMEKEAIAPALVAESIITILSSGIVIRK